MATLFAHLQFNTWNDILKFYYISETKSLAFLLHIFKELKKVLNFDPFIYLLCDKNRNSSGFE